MIPVPTVVPPPPAVQVVLAVGAVHVTTAVLAPATDVVLIFDGHVIVIGPPVPVPPPAVTVTWKEQVVVLPQPSVAE